MTEMQCADAMRQLWDYLDGELAREQAVLLAAHLAVCQRCHPQIAFEQAFLAVLAAARRDHHDPVALRRRIVAALQAEGLQPPPRS
jgi:anti-sigma factor (TIGR02949 family)